MARIRTIKPEYWLHPIMARLPADTQLLALALLNHADDHGYFHADPALVRSACCPFRESLASVSRILASLSEVGWIKVKIHPEHGDIGFIVNWSKHQRVDHPSPSKIECYYSSRESRELLAKPRETFALDQGSGNRDQGKEQGKENILADARCVPSESVPPVDPEPKAKRGRKPKARTIEQLMLDKHGYRVKGNKAQKLSALMDAFKILGPDEFDEKIIFITDCWVTDLHKRLGIVNLDAEPETPLVSDEQLAEWVRIAKGEQQ